MFFTVVMSLFVGLVPCMLFGFVVMHRFEKLRAPEILGYVRSRKIKAPFWLLVAFGWPVVINHLALASRVDTPIGYVLAFALGVVAMVSGAYWRTTERKEEEEKHLAGEGTGY